MNASDIIKLLQTKYSPPDYAFLTQVRNQTGYSVKDGIRTADGLALCLYPSRGLYLNGFEIKVSRSDWATERRNPEKADAIGKFCHYWWIIAPDINTVPLHELPETWGLQVVSDGKLHVAKQAKFMNPEPITMPFLAAIFRKLSETTVPIDFLKDRIEQRVAEVLKSDEWQARYRVEECEKLEKRVAEFEERSGIEIDHWDLGEVADAVSGNHYSELQRIKELANRIVEKIDEGLYEKKT
jgi:hypothetical protein